MDEKRNKPRTTAKPFTPEFWRQMLAIAKGSDHPRDKALVSTLKQELAEAESNLHKNG